MNVDPAASMRCWAVDLEIGDRVYEIPALPAADWWPLLAEGALAGLLDLLPAGHDLDDRLIDESDLSEELASAFPEVLETVCGRTPAEATTIAAVALGAWSWLGGKLALSGFRWDVMPISAALDAIHALLMEHLTEDGRKKYEALLTQAAPKQIDREAALSEFEAAAGPRPAAQPLSTGAPSGDRPARSRQPSRPPRRRDRSAAPTALPAPPAGSAPEPTSAPLAPGV